SEAGGNGLKAMKPTAVAKARTARSETISLRVKLTRRACAQSTIAGVTTRPPAASPSHHVTQIGASLSQAANPATYKVVTPMVALVMVAGPTQIRANFATCAGVSKVP